MRSEEWFIDFLVNNWVSFAKKKERLGRCQLKDYKQI
jgi:hypothetical protein